MCILKVAVVEVDCGRIGVARVDDDGDARGEEGERSLAVVPLPGVVSGVTVKEREGRAV
jgi:hypothetical protein